MTVQESLQKALREIDNEVHRKDTNQDCDLVVENSKAILRAIAREFVPNSIQITEEELQPALHHMCEAFIIAVNPGMKRSGLWF